LLLIAGEKAPGDFLTGDLPIVEELFSLGLHGRTRPLADARLQQLADHP